MLSDWQFIALFAVIAIIFPGAPLMMASLINPKKPNPIKQQTYECGMETVGDTWIQFKVQYYIFALIFVVFDLEAVFLFPIASAFDQLTLFAIFEVVLFVVILLVALGYAWRRGALEWF
ncbi:MAG: NADH-quinone oxidoreductase subunit A [Anaerolineae bacterium]|nr:MAG: NADH-quinone oxidoreductase subunit A [Anaerolineae bacterium]